MTTLQEKREILKLLIFMFNASPGAATMAQVETLYEIGNHDLEALAAALEQTPAYQQACCPSTSPMSVFVNSLLVSVNLQNDADTVSILTSLLLGGMSRGTLIFQCHLFLNKVTVTPAAYTANYQTAAKMYENKADVSFYFSITRAVDAVDFNAMRAVVALVTSDVKTSIEAQIAIDRARPVVYSGPGPSWAALGSLPGILSTANYTPLVGSPADLRVYANGNSSGGDAGKMHLYEGTFAGMGASRKVLEITDPNDAYIRTFAVCRGEVSGKYYALLYTGQLYGSTGGYTPSFAVSNDGENWTWKGSVSPYGRRQHSAAAMVVDETRVDAFRFMAWLDNAGSTCRMMHSADGLVWVDGGDMWPASLAGDDAQFLTACKTPYGVHLIATHNFPATEHRHLWSPNGINSWRVLETNCPTCVGAKGTNLVYSRPDNSVYALTASMLFGFPAEVF